MSVARQTLDVGPPPILIRPPVDDDWPLIRDSWRKSYREGGSINWVHHRDYNHELDGVIQRAVDSDGVSFLVAAAEDDESFVWGWACIEKPDLAHYCYTKRSARRHGIASLLLAALAATPVRCSHWTRACEEIALQSPGRLVYTPSAKP